VAENTYTWNCELSKCCSKYSYNEVQYFRSSFIEENQITRRNSKPIKRVRSLSRFLKRTRENRGELVTISSRFTSNRQAKEHVSLRASEPADQPMKTYTENQLNQSWLKGRLKGTSRGLCRELENMLLISWESSATFFCNHWRSSLKQDLISFKIIVNT